MKKILKLMIMLLITISLVGFGYFLGKQAPGYLKHTVKYDEQYDEDRLFDKWLETYLNSHLEPLNKNENLDFVDIEVLHYNTYSEATGDNSGYRVVITGQAEKAPDKLFATKPFFEDGHFKYDLYMILRFEEEGVSYISDQSYEKHQQQMDEFYRPEAVDPFAELYNKDSMNLEVRERTDSPWIKTPIEVSQFNTQSYGWYRKDQRIYFKEDEIAIVHSTPESKISITQSHDRGKSWKTKSILTNEEIAEYAIPFAYLSFVGDEGVLVLSSAIAGSSEIMTMYKTIDRGDTWQAGSIPEASRRPHSVSFIDPGRVFVTSTDDPLLYTTEDLGETYRSIGIPDYELNKDFLFSEGLKWSDFYVQAEAPFVQNDKYYMTMTQGDNGDYNGNANALYQSKDKGETWSFVRYEFPVEKPEEN